MWEIHCSSRAVHQRFTNSPRNVHIHIVFAVLARVRLKFHKRCISIRTAIAVLSQPFNKCFAMRDNVFTNIPQTIRKQFTTSVQKVYANHPRTAKSSHQLIYASKQSHTFHTRFTHVSHKYSQDFHTKIPTLPTTFHEHITHLPQDVNGLFKRLYTVSEILVEYMR